MLSLATSPSLHLLRNRLRIQEQICSSPATQDTESPEVGCLPFKKQKRPDSSPAGVLVDCACQHGAPMLHKGPDGAFVALQRTPGIDDAFLGRKTELQLQVKCNCSARACGRTRWPVQVESGTGLRRCVIPLPNECEPQDGLAAAAS